MSSARVAVKCGDISRIKDIISSGFDINVPDNDGRTLLMWACSSGQPEIARVLIASGADVNVEGSADLFPLMCAVDSYSDSRSECLRVLLESGADPYRINYRGNTVLHEASCFGYSNHVAVLLDAGVEADCRNELNETALLLAASCGHCDTVDALLAAGAEKDICVNGIDTPLLLAAMHEHRDTVCRLVEYGARYDDFVLNGRSLMRHAKACGWKNVVSAIERRELNDLNLGRDTDHSCDGLSL